MKNLVILLLAVATAFTTVLGQSSSDLLGSSSIEAEDESCDGKLKISAFGSNCLQKLGINAQNLVDAGPYDLSLIAGFSTNRYYGTNSMRFGMGYQLTQALGVYVGGATRSTPTNHGYGSRASDASASRLLNRGGFGNFVWTTTITGEITPFATFFEGPIWQQIVIDYNITTDFADRPEITGIGSITFEQPFFAFGRNFRTYFGAWSQVFDNFPEFVRGTGNKFRFNSDFGLTAGIGFCL
ncbi:MAG: hypothetical protein KTR30_26000 [Saprospiraceae bacterium]|nr:hypothetical protein [Saprospiraceae bacterium]